MWSIIDKIRDLYHEYIGGNKTISDYKEGDKIKLATDIAGVAIFGPSFIFKTKLGELIIDEAADKLIEIIDNDDVTKAYAYLTNNTGIVDRSDSSVFEIIEGALGLSNYLIAGSGGSSLVGNGGNNTLQGGIGKDSFVYSGDNDVVLNYATGDIINFVSDFIGVGISANDFLLNSSNGSVIIRDALDKIIDVADVDNNIFTRAYISSTATELDGRGISGTEVIIGGNDGGDMIYSGDGGSSLWGGEGNFNDSLFGGAGQDEIFYMVGNGQDEIFNVNSKDIINLLGVNLDQIVDAVINDDSSQIRFTDGGSLNILGQAGKFLLNGKAYFADYQNKRWLTDGET
ncbi:MAG: hypothetical protein IKZ58_01935 [Selenomonadaceae bacterium]|nr:hypothetical protein [Selenomonadaceae bacterium]